jgi:hypothetical protein
MPRLQIGYRLTADSSTTIVKPLSHGVSPALVGKQACESETRHHQIRSSAHRVYIRQLQRRPVTGISFVYSSGLRFHKKCKRYPRRWYKTRMSVMPEQNKLIYVINTTNLIHTSLLLSLYWGSSLDMFRALLAHHHETLHKRSFGDLCAVVVEGLSETNPHLQLHTIFTKAAFV